MTWSKEGVYNLSGYEYGESNIEDRWQIIHYTNSVGL